MAAIEGKELEGILDKALENADRLDKMMAGKSLKDVVDDVLPELVTLSLGMPVYVPDLLKAEVRPGLLDRVPQVFKGAAGELKLWPAKMSELVPDINRAIGVLGRLAGRLVPITDALQYVAKKIPWIDDVRVSLAPKEEMGIYSGLWMPESRVIKVSDDLPLTRMPEVLAHEVQHAVMSKGPTKALMGWSPSVNPDIARDYVMSPGGLDVLDRLEGDVLDFILSRSRSLNSQQIARAFDEKLRKALYETNMGELLANRTARRVREFERTGVDVPDLELAHVKDYAWW